MVKHIHGTVLSNIKMVHFHIFPYLFYSVGYRQRTLINILATWLNANMADLAQELKFISHLEAGS